MTTDFDTLTYEQALHSKAVLIQWRENLLDRCAPECDAAERERLSSRIMGITTELVALMGWLTKHTRY